MLMFQRPFPSIALGRFLKEKKMISKVADYGLKVLGNGELTKKLTVKAAVFTKTAQEKIEKAGGKIEVL